MLKLGGANGPRALAMLLAPLFAIGCGPGDSGGIDSSATVDLLAASVRSRVTQESLEPHARAIVEHERPSGSPGENAAIDYVVQTLEAAGVPVEVHSFEAFTSDPISASVGIPGTDRTFNAITASFSASVPGLEAPLVDVGPLEDLPAIEVGTGERLVLEGEDMGGPFARPYPDLSGSIALVDGLPRNIPTAVLERLGAVGAIFVNPDERVNDLIVTSTWGTPSLLNYHRLPNLPVAHVPLSTGEALRGMLEQGPLDISLSTEVDTGWRELRLAVARVPGPEPEAPYVLFGGHIDAWYHGGTDEGASNAAMLDLAIAFHAERQRLQRGLVVAWWPGHSNARYGGSTWFADHFFTELRQRAVAYVNVDGIGQTGARSFSAATTVSLADLARRVVLRREAAEIEPGRPGRNSDQSFNGIGVPLLQLSHNRLAEDRGYWWWHTPDDTFDKIDFGVLERDTYLYVDALSALLAEAVVPVDLVAQVEALGDAIVERQDGGGGQFDLGEATLLQAEFLRLARQVVTSLPATGSPELDLALVDVLRPLHRVMYVPLTVHHPDAGSVPGPLPGLAATRILSTEEFGTERYRLATATLVRERNRLIEAIGVSVDRIERLLDDFGNG